LEEQKQFEAEFSDEEPNNAKGKTVAEPIIESKEEQDYQLV
jgi:hypothetical protein